MKGLVGQTLGAYRILEQIGRGGMATVFKAYQPALDRYVAIKILPPHLADEPGFAQRFKRDARAVAKLEHPHILAVYDSGRDNDLSYLVMRYVEAGTLKAQMGHPLDLDRVTDLIGQISEALDYAHEEGIVHRDIKPSNILMDREDWALLSDFGLAKMMEGSQQITETGVGLGTPDYMSPEQGMAERVDQRSDIYSLGVVLYEMLTGRVPYKADTPMAVVLKHIHDPLPLPRKINPNIPDAIERVVLKAMAKDPGDRFERARELAEALREAAKGVEISGIGLSRTSAPPISEASGEHPAPGLFRRTRRLLRVLPVALLIVVVGLLVTQIPIRVQIVGGRLEIVSIEQAADTNKPADEASDIPTAESTGLPQEGGLEREAPVIVASSEPNAQELGEFTFGSILFEDDFEDGDLFGWIQQGSGWSLVSEESGNTVLQGTGSENPGSFYELGTGNQPWTDYAVEFRVFLIEFGNPPFDRYFSVNVRDDGPGCDNYTWALSVGFATLSKATDCEYHTLRNSLGFRMAEGAWTNVRVEVVENFIKVVVDGTVAAEIFDPSDFHVSGGIAIGVPPTNTMWFDDIRVIELGGGAPPLSEMTVGGISPTDGVSTVWALPPQVDVQAWIEGVDEFKSLMEAVTDHPIGISIGESLDSVLDALCSGDAQVSFLDHWAYLKAADEGCAEAALVSIRFGLPTFSSQVVARKDSGIEDIADAAGKTFCRSDEASTSGWIVPRLLFLNAAIDPETSFTSIIDVGGHPQVIEALYLNQCQLGATFVDARAVAETGPDVYEQIVVVATTPDIPNPSIVFSPSLSSEDREAIVSAIMALRSDQMDLLENLFQVQGFDLIGDSDYDGLRDLIEAAGLTIDHFVE